MANYRNSLPAEQLPAYDKAMTAVAIILGRGRSIRDSLPAEEAARLAWVAGGPSIEELTETIRRYRAEARAAMDAGMAGAA